MKKSIVSMKMGKLLIIFFVFGYIQTDSIKAQSLSAIQDSCYFFLEQQDTISFNRTFVKVFDALKQQMDPEMYQLQKELCEMGNQDQSIRFLLIDAQKRFGKDDFHTQSIRELMNGIDSLNVKRIIQIIDKYGWLSSEEIGEDANEAIFYCIQHCNDAMIQTKYLPILKEAVKAGAAEGWQYAFLTDRCLMNQGKDQIYGTQTIKAKNNRTYLVPLQDVNMVVQLRQEAGLQPLEEYMRDFGENWSKDLYRKELPEYKKTFQDWYNHKKEN